MNVESRRLSPSRWAQCRAAVITFFLIFNVLAALPTLGTPSAERLQRPFEQGELRRWGKLLAAIGLDLSLQQLTEIYLAWANGALEARALALWPIEGFTSFTQTAQGWRLFGTPDEYRMVLRISAFAGDPAREQVLYESGNPARRWNADRLEYRRVRAAYNPSRAGPPATYAGLGQRLSEQIFAERTDVSRVRIVLDRGRIPLPGVAPEPAHEEQHVLEFTRPAP